MLHHYTTAAGLLGILDTRRLWATNARFFNDPTEIDYAVSLASEIMGAKVEARSKAEAAAKGTKAEAPTKAAKAAAADKAEPGPKSSFRQAGLVGVMGRLFEAVGKAFTLEGRIDAIFKNIGDVYIACFCEEGDLLSQWRGYAASGGGYALGLGGPLIARDEASSKVILRKVIYDPKKQRKVLEDWLDALLDRKSVV